MADTQLAINGKTSMHFTIAPSNAINKERAELILTGVPADDLVAINGAIEALHTARGENTDIAIRIDFLGGTIDVGTKSDGSAIVIPVGYDNIHLFGNGVSVRGKVSGISLSSLFDIKANSIHLNGFELANTWSNNPNGICLNNSGSSCVITGNFCNSAFYSLKNSGTLCTIAGNTCSSTATASLGNTGSDCDITGNTCNTNNTGVENGGNNCIIAGNTCNSVQSTALANTGLKCTITGNICYSSAYRGLNNSGGGCTITGNICSGEIALYNISMSTEDKCIISSNICINGGISVKTGTCLPETQLAMADVNTGSITLRP